MDDHPEGIAMSINSKLNLPNLVAEIASSKSEAPEKYHFEKLRKYLLQVKLNFR